MVCLRIFRRCAAVFLACILIVQTVSAAGLTGYKDLDGAFTNQEAVAYVTERGCMRGYADGTFRPDAPVGLGALASVAARFLGTDLSGHDGVTWLTDMGYLDAGVVEANRAAVRPDVAMCALGRAFGVLPMQSQSTEHLAYKPSDGAEYMRNAGIELGIFDWTVNAILERDVLTRGDLAYLVYRMGSFRDEYPGVTGYGWEYLRVESRDAYAYLVLDVWDDILIMPWAIVKHYHDAGFGIMCDDVYINHWAEANSYWRKGSNTFVAAVFAESLGTIFVQDINAVIHEMGHYAEKFMFGTVEAEAAYPRERDAAAEYISGYASSDPGEFFAECFEYYVRAKNAGNYADMDMMRERLPETYAYLANKDVQNWCAPARYIAPDVVSSGVYPVNP